MTIFLQGNIKSQRGNGLENIKLVVSDNYLPTLDTNILIEENRNLFFWMRYCHAWVLVLVHGTDQIQNSWSKNFSTSYSKAKTIY